MKNNKILLILSSIVLVYSLLGFVILPLILKSQIEKTINSMINYNATIYKIDFNPFLLKTKIHNFAIKDKTKEIITFKELYVDFSLLKSIHERHISFKQIQLLDPVINIVQNSDGSINLLSILKEKKNDATAEETEKENSIFFKITKTILSNATINFTHFNNEKANTISLNQLDYTFYDLGTHNNSLASHNLDTNINKNTQVHVEGGFNLTPFRMYGKVNIKNLKPKEFISLTKDLLQFQISNTSLDIDLGYTLDLKDELSLVLNDANIHVNKFDVTKNKEKIIGFNAFDINNFNLKYPEQEINIDSISLDKLFAAITKNKDESLNVSSLVKQQDGHRIEEFKEKRAERKKWDIKLDTFNINQSNFNFNDLKTSTVLSTKNINLNVKQLDFDGDNINISKVNLSKPTLSIANKTIEIKTQPFNLAVNSISSNLKDFNIKSIKLEDNGVTFNDKANHTSFKGEKSQLLATNIQSKNSVITINKINTKHNDMKIENKANSLNIIAKNIDVRVDKFLFRENYLSIKKSTINRPFANIIVGKQAKKKEETKDKKKKKVVKKTSREKPTFNFDIGPATIKNAKVVFEDKNLPIPFKTNITKLDGSFSELSSTSTKPTKLKLSGNVDKYGSTKVSGLLEHKDIKELVDVKLIFKNIAIKNFTPYSGKFVGRELAGGKLNLDLNYNVKKSNLKAQNSVIISDIKLGKKIESPDAMSLPLELGIALLEDRHGIININMPLSGNVDDPDFSIAPLVWQVFTNLIVKAVTSPFSFLASLIGLEGDELKSAEFDIGVATILPHIKERLDNITQIFEKRPNISLVVTPAYSLKEDTLALQKIKLDKKINTQMKKIKAEDRYQQVLETMAGIHFKELNLEKAKEKYTTKKVFDKESYLEYLKTILETKEVITNEELEKLALLRVQNISDYLVKNKIEKTRIVIEEKIENVASKNNSVAINFKIDIKK